MAFLVNVRWYLTAELICVTLMIRLPCGSDGKASAYIQEARVPALGWEDLLEKVMATYSSILGWKIPGTEEPGRLQSMVLQRVRHN